MHFNQCSSVIFRPLFGTLVNKHQLRERILFQFWTKHNGVSTSWPIFNEFKRSFQFMGFFLYRIRTQQEKGDSAQLHFSCFIDFYLIFTIFISLKFAWKLKFYYIQLIVSKFYEKSIREKKKTSHKRMFHKKCLTSELIWKENGENKTVN